jgi:outer membrane protein
MGSIAYLFRRSVAVRRAGLALVAGVALALPATSRAETLTDALISSYQSSGLLEQNRALLRAADEDVAQAVSTLRPVLSYIVQGRWQDNDQIPGGAQSSASLGLSLDWTLFDFGRSALAVDAAKEAVLALRAALVDIEQQVLLRAVSAYMEVRRAQAFVQLNQNNVRLLQEQLRATQDRFEVGEVTRTDVALVEARLAAGRSGLAAAMGDLARAQAEYVSAVGQAPSALRVPPPAPATAPSRAAAENVALSRHPSLIRAQREVAAADIGVNIARAALYPRISAGGQIGRDDSGSDTRSLSLSLSGPIYSGGAINSAMRAANARRDAARARLLLETQGVVQNVANAWANLEVATAIIVASEEQVAAATLALRGAREEFEVGEGTTIDVLDRENELLSAQTDLIDAQTNRYVASFALLSRMGLLTVEHLDLGVPTYDPAAYYNAVRNAPLGSVSPQGQQLDRLLRAIGRE